MDANISMVFGDYISTCDIQQDNGKQRWLQVMTELSRAFALSSSNDEATTIRDDVSFFQAVQAALAKQPRGSGKTPEQIDAALRQLVSRAISTDGEVIDVFSAACLPKPDVSILMLKRILNQYGYLPDLQAGAVYTVLAQAKLLCAWWL